MAATLRCKPLLAAGAILGAILWSAPALAKDWYPYPVEEWNPPFDMSSPRKKIQYVPLPKASKKSVTKKSAPKTSKSENARPRRQPKETG